MQEAVSIVQLFSSTVYSFVLEALTRLVLAADLLRVRPKMVLIGEWVINRPSRLVRRGEWAPSVSIDPDPYMH